MRAQILSLLVLAACDGTAHLSSGSWIPVQAFVDGEVQAPPAGSLELDVDAGAAVFLDGGGAEILAANLEVLARQDWPEGCPTNFSATRMEVARLDSDQVALGDVVVADPVLMASCPDGDGLRLMVGWDWDLGDGACFESEACVVYE